MKKRHKEYTDFKIQRFRTRRQSLNLKPEHFDQVFEEETNSGETTAKGE